MSGIEILWLSFVASLAVGAAFYAQLRIPRHTAGRSKVLFLRGLLAAVGVALGVIAAAAMQDSGAAVLAFLAGFGIAHVPAAFVLFFKGARHEGMT
jgi:hypothetical protein